MAKINVERTCMSCLKKRRTNNPERVGWRSFHFGTGNDIFFLCDKCLIKYDYKPIRTTESDYIDTHDCKYVLLYDPFTSPSKRIRQFNGYKVKT